MKASSRTVAATIHAGPHPLTTSSPRWVGCRLRGAGPWRPACPPHQWFNPPRPFLPLLPPKALSPKSPVTWRLHNPTGNFQALFCLTSQEYIVLLTTAFYEKNTLKLASKTSLLLPGFLPSPFLFLLLFPLKPLALLSPKPFTLLIHNLSPGRLALTSEIQLLSIYE